MYDINTIDELVDALGGDSVLAGSLGISQPAVANWKQRNHIAAGWHLRLLAKIRAAGMTVDPKVFGLTAEEGDVLLAPFRRPRAGNVAAA